jgi:hypothetical protein
LNIEHPTSNIEVEENEDAASSWDRGHPARLGACGDGVGAAGPRRPTGVENQDFKNQEAR